MPGSLSFLFTVTYQSPTYVCSGQSVARGNGSALKPSFSEGPADFACPRENADGVGDEWVFSSIVVISKTQRPSGTRIETFTSLWLKLSLPRFLGSAFQFLFDLQGFMSEAVKSLAGSRSTANGVRARTGKHHPQQACPAPVGRARS
ncbi:hypothetical protein NMY22_g15344 [Coprinellus aureogranulatus]|nr:hypothetical protein NMY22_g15344 [Coprinellus aureogranulatus]